MYGDPDIIRRQVLRLREQGVDIRVLADHLVGRVEGADWTGRAADTMQMRMHERAARLRDAAGRHDVAADSLERHLARVETATETIATRQRKASDLVADARARITRATQANRSDGVVVQADPADEKVAGFEAPPDGHKDWLGVELPGL